MITVDQLAVKRYIHRNKLDEAKSTLDDEETIRQLALKGAASFDDATDEQALDYLRRTGQV